MLRECFDRPDECRKLAIGRGDSTTGPRLGGRPPAGLRPEPGTLVYLVTVPWDAASDLSVFVDADPEFIYGDVELPCGRPHFDVMRHPPLPRGDSRHHSSGVSEHPIIIGPCVGDVGPIDENGVACPFSGHKIGGAPYYVRRGTQLEAAVQRLLARGFVHALALDFPSDPEADVSGPWPFGTGIFHLLLRDDCGELTWACFWEA